MGMFQNFMLKQVMRSKLKGVPEDEQKRIMQMVEANPDFFKKVADEIEKRKKSGQNEMQASMQVMREHQAELQKLMQP
jgi:hypothetical protein